MRARQPTAATATATAKAATAKAATATAATAAAARRARWADPRVRLAVGLLGLAATVPFDRDRVGEREARAFRRVNDLPDRWYRPLWVVMQAGALGAAPVAAAVAYLAGDRRLARRMVLTAPAAWALSKVVKRGVRRGRPPALLQGVHVRGSEATGLGYLSGHAGVAVALGLAARRRLGPGGRAAAAALVPLVGASRMYVGAHLPLDVAGGAALGLALDAALDVWDVR